MAAKYPVVINGEDFGQMVECDSYETSVQVVYSEVVTTMDGVDHTKQLRLRGVFSAAFNPQTAANTAKLCKALLASPVQVQYHCLQRDEDVSAKMIVDSVTSQYLARVLCGGKKWNETRPITLKEL